MTERQKIREFLNDYYPNHTGESVWNKSEVIHMLEEFTSQKEEKIYQLEQTVKKIQQLALVSLLGKNKVK